MRMLSIALHPHGPGIPLLVYMIAGQSWNAKNFLAKF